MENKKNVHEHIIISLKFFMREMFLLVKSPVFLLLTIMGNLLISIFSLIFYMIEKSTNSKLSSFIDALWWGFSTATTTGYGDITPVTHAGKFLGILLMLSGTAIFAMFTALFAETILSSSRQHKK